MTIANKERYKQIDLALRAMCFQEMDKMFSRLEKLVKQSVPVPIKKAFLVPFYVRGALRISSKRSSRIFHASYLSARALNLSAVLSPASASAMAEAMEETAASLYSPW